MSLPLAGCALAEGPFHPADRRCDWCGFSLPPGRLAWCSESCGREYVENHHWAKARTTALRRDGHRCVLCTATDPLEVHHIEPVGELGYGPGCQHHLAGLMSVCAAHHRLLKKRGIPMFADVGPGAVVVLRPETPLG